jgi:hypothetical protein
MSAQLRRAQLKVQKAEALLAAARLQLVAEEAREAERTRQKEESKAEKKAQMKAYNEDPIVKRANARHLLMTAYSERGMRYGEDVVDAYLEWRKTDPAAERCRNAYERVQLYAESRPPVKPFNIFAKTLAGELIPLNYHPEADKRSLINQLATAFPEEFPVGSTMICMGDEPLEEDSVVGLLSKPLSLITYSKLSVWNSGENDLGPAMRYQFFVKPEGILQDALNPITYNQEITIVYFPLTCSFRLTWNGLTYPISELSNQLRTYSIATNYYRNTRKTFTDAAQEELVHAFHAVRIY